MNKVQSDFLSLLENHRSIRHFLDKKIPDFDIRRIITAAQSVSTSSNGQAFSIINVTDQEMKKKLANYAGSQKQVEDCSNFLVFCADLFRLEQISQRLNVEMKKVLDSTEMFLIATIDATLVAQNTVVAAESLGYGIVYTGGIRNNPEKVSELLNLPYRTFPVFGICIGYPDPNRIPEKKPRLPLGAVFYQNEYPNFDEVYPYINKYDETMKEYYRNRSESKREDTWSKTITDKRKIPRRMNMKSFLEEQGYPLK
ncbi:oxygen-insensitive NADPH nitroreductase [Robertmurraya yapensis]|uniref:Oxygen-insensitive NADPH nitroreductase n=1 Tax=Bacillus yapensis TaxID=2492960 RepID=A0A431WIP7_9BACI|nr:oxygen-insensitive NADPH nitroreductase [Bacillus yapensis]RTR35169.1 oxygen-insensitive NADPH nitroreductase [Bacillus yapensis]TKS97678.1 oxygen-insensitive NADPH nitroreductase [Bacillus yapensis]